MESLKACGTNGMNTIVSASETLKNRYASASHLQAAWRITVSRNVRAAEKAAQVPTGPFLRVDVLAAAPYPPLMSCNEYAYERARPVASPAGCDDPKDPSDQQDRLPIAPHDHRVNSVPPGLRGSLSGHEHHHRG